MKTKTQKHAEGPLEAKPFPSTQIISRYDDGSERGVIAHVSLDGAESKEEAQATKERLVACYNVCAGINPEAVPELLRVATAVLDFLSVSGFEMPANPKTERLSKDALRSAIRKARAWEE